MKTTLGILIASMALLLAPSASSAIYTGTWKNTTFGSSGALKIDVTIKDNRAKGSLDLDGNVFGGADPPAIPFNFPFNPNTAGKFKVSGTLLGNLAGTYSKDGDLTVTITKTPGGFPKETRIDGKLDLKLQTFKATYEIDDDAGLFAEGTAAAHVHKKPVIKAPSEVKVTGKTGEASAKVVSNTKIKNVKASSPDGATVKISGNNPYLIKAGKLNKPTNRVIFSATNADGLTQTKTIRFIRTDLKSAAGILLDPPRD
jgi:hypothetical protein